MADNTKEHAAEAPGFGAKLWHTIKEGAKKAVIAAGIGIIGGLIVGAVANYFIPNAQAIKSGAGASLKKCVEKAVLHLEQCIANAGHAPLPEGGATLSRLARRIINFISQNHPIQNEVNHILETGRSAAHYALPAVGAATGAVTGFVGGGITGTLTGGYEAFIQKEAAGPYSEKILAERLSETTRLIK